MTPKKKIHIYNTQETDTGEQLLLVQEILENTQASIKKALNLIKDKGINTDSLLSSLKEAKEASNGNASSNGSGQRVIEGVFNGEKMVGGDGIEYNIPANYASKSKLVEGDLLKLTITSDGSFLYKQIGPVERQQLVADLLQSENGDWYGVIDKKRWKLLTASVTYFHGDAGDQVVILVPKGGKSMWAAVENIIKVNR